MAGMTELWIPGAIRKPLPINPARDPIIVPAGAVFHVAVFRGDSLFDMYRNRDDGIESTGYIRFDGTIEQYRPVNVECDAQLAGNSWHDNGVRRGLTSWETAGMGPGEWTPAQLASIQRIVRWHHAEHGSPLRVNPGPTSSGFGYHRLFRAWNPNAHSCPGDDRVKQWNRIIVPWLAAGANTVEDDMEPKQIAAAPITLTDPGGKKVETTVQGALDDTRDRVLAGNAAIREIRDKLIPAIMAKLDEIAGKAPGA